MDTLILGCTHYPIISAIIGSVMGRGVTLINSGGKQPWHWPVRCGKGAALRRRFPRRASYYVTDAPESFTAVAELFLGHSVEGRTERITMEGC